MKVKNLSPILWYPAILLAIFSASVRAQLDPTFGTNGVASLEVFNNDTPVESFLLPNGKIFIVNRGSASGSSPSYKYHFVRFNADGTPDTRYGTNGTVELQLPIPNPKIVSATRQSDGKILLVGGGSLIRYNENGTLDYTFSDDGYHTPNIDHNATETVNSVVQQPDGRLVLVGTILSNDAPYGPNGLFLVRYELNGLLDPTFGDHMGFIVHAIPYPNAGEIVVQRTGKFLVVPPRERDDTGFYFDGTINRYNPNGTMDFSFPPIFLAGNTIRSFKLLRSDKFLVAQNTLKTDSLLRTQTDMTISRFTADGALDPNFGVDGKTSIDVASAMGDETLALSEYSKDKIVIAGGTNIEPNRSKCVGLNLSLVRLNSNGSVEGKFLATNITPLFYPYSVYPLPYKGQILMQPDGKIITVSSKEGPESRDLLITRSTNVPLRAYRFHGIPYSFLNYYYANASVYRPSNRNWYFNTGLNPVFFGLSQDILAPSDFLGDFRTDVAVFRPSEGMWYIARPNGVPAQDFVSIKWGKTGDIPIPRDYNGDSKSDVAVFRPSEGNWYIRNSGDDSIRIENWGMNGDKPVAGDYDGDGFDDIAVFRPSDANWYISRSSDGQTTVVHFGMSGDIPVQEDYDGDGKVDVAMWRPSSGDWHILHSSDASYTVVNWGAPNDIPTPSDYDGDKKIDIAVWRSSERNWYIIYSDTDSVGRFSFGQSLDIPTQGRY
jgi:uncharacterized delta-60 repeat protein